MSSQPVYRTVLVDITESQNQKPQNRKNIKYTQIPSLRSTEYKTAKSNYNDNLENYYTPNAGHNATVNSYVFDPTLTTLKREEKKDKFEFQNQPIIDEDNSSGIDLNNINGENLITNLDKNLEEMKRDNELYKSKKKNQTITQPKYISEDDIEKRKDELLGNYDKTQNIFLEKKRRDKEYLNRYMKLNEGQIPIEESKELTTEEKLNKILKEQNELKDKRMENMKILSMKNFLKHGVRRKGYTEHKPIDEKDDKFIRKYARYLLFKKIKDDIYGNDDDEYEREYAKYIFTAHSENSPRSLSLNEGYKSNKKKINLSSLNGDITSSLSDLKYSNLNSFIAFIKMIYAMLDKDKKKLISKQQIQEEIDLDDRILQDLGFENSNQFKEILMKFEPEDKENDLLNERDFIYFLLSQSDLKNELNDFFDEKKSMEPKRKKHRKRRGKKNDEDSEVEISENDSSDDLPGLRTHIYDFLELPNDKMKLDALNEIYNKTINPKKTFNKKKAKKQKLKLKNERMKISYHEYLTFLRRYHTKDQINFTIPEPFDFLKKDYQKKKLEKIREILEERVQIEDYYLNYKFEPNKLKEGIWGNQMEDMVKNEKEIRLKRQEKLKEKIIAEMKPFSFYDEDERKYKERLQQESIPPQFPPFRANAIKWLSQVNIYQDMLKKEKEERENRIRERIEKTMNASKLPPRMQMYADEMKKKKENEDNESTRSKSSTYKFKANKVPDFAKLQEEFENKLDAMKKSAIPTKIVPFTFHEPKKKIELCKFLDNENNPQSKNPKMKNNINEIIKKMQRKPKIEPASTHSLDLLMETRRRELEEKQRKINEQKLEDQLRKERQDRLKERVQNSKAIVDNKKVLEENRRKQQEDFRNNLIKKRESYENELQRRVEKVYNKPLMLEQIGNLGEKFSMGKNTKDDLNELLSEQADGEFDDGDENDNGEIRSGDEGPDEKGEDEEEEE